MATFDPSVISEIGPAAIPDVAGAKARGFQLKDLMDQNTINESKIRQDNQAQADSATLRRITAKYDINNPQQRSAMASELQRAGLPDAATSVIKMGQSLDSGAAARQQDQLTLHHTALAEINDRVGQVVNQIGALRDAKNPDGTPMYDSKTIDAMTQAQVLKMTNDIKNDPTLAADVKQLLMGQINQQLSTGKPITFDQISAGYRASKQGQEQIQAHLAQQNLQSQISDRDQQAQDRTADLAERTRHDRAAEATQRSNASAFGGDNAALLGAFADRGVSLPTGLRSKQQILATLNGLRAAHPGQTPEQIADGVASGQIKFGAERTETRSAAQIGGRTVTGENELEAFAPPTIAASNAVPRGKFTPVSRLIQLGKSKVSDPNLKELLVRTNSFLNAYDTLTARGGTDPEKRRINRQNLLNADSPEAYQRAVNTMLSEGKLAVGAVRAAEGRGPAPSATPSGSSNVVDWSSLK